MSITMLIAKQQGQADWSKREQGSLKILGATASFTIWTREVIGLNDCWLTEK